MVPSARVTCCLVLFLCQRSHAGTFPASCWGFDPQPKVLCPWSSDRAGAVKYAYLAQQWRCERRLSSMILPWRLAGSIGWIISTAKLKGASFSSKILIWMMVTWWFQSKSSKIFKSRCNNAEFKGISKWVVGQGAELFLQNGSKSFGLFHLILLNLFLG